MRTKSIIIPVLFLAALVFQSCGRLAITHIDLFDPVTGSMLPNRTILLRGERIVGVSTPESPLKIPVFSKVINGSGKYIIPGLIDAHSHIVFPLDSANVNGEDILPLYLGNGVTSVRNIGDGIIKQKRVADYADAHRKTCPTVFMCSPLIDGPDPYHGTDLVSTPIADPAAVPAFVDSMVSYGVTTLKIYVYADSAVFRKVIEEGHKRGLTVAAHLPSNKVRTEDALDWGLDVIEHVFGAPGDSLLIAQMVEQGTMFDPTLVVFKNMLLFNNQPEIYQNKDNDYVPVSLLEFWDKYRANATWSNERLTDKNLQSRNDTMAKYKKITGDLYRAGITILAGTDSPEPYCPPGFALHDELELLVESGLPPAAALKCATINNARALRQTDNLGSIETGKIADLVILNANPLTDIRNTRNIHLVIHRGIVSNPKSVFPSSRVR